MSLHLSGGEHIDFGANLVGICATLSCLHNILLTSCWILTKLSWIYNLDITECWFDLVDLDLIFKVTAVDKLKIHGGGTSVFSENTDTI